MRPAFDVDRYAEDLVGRERFPTMVDEVATEQARLASVLMDSTPPEPPRAPPTPEAPVRAQAGARPRSRREPPPDIEAEIAAEMADLEADIPRYEVVEALDDDAQLSLLRARLAPMTRVPTLARKITELGALIEDPKTAYVLGFVDGLLPLETIVEVAGLPELDTLRILNRAVEQFVLTFPR